ncbi:MAG TPA: Ig-like domain-containing protein, partial [Bacteroidota bacterium]|nr:Ig-like domain-containing protein [Bacteroidota bacterium]
VVFSEPMSALTVAGQGMGRHPFTITPAVAGTFHWIGTTTCAFTPADTLPASTRFTVTIPQGTRSLSGSQISKPFTWTFETPRPALVRTLPREKSTRIASDRVILLQFNQPIDLATIGRWISIEERSPAGIRESRAFTLRKPTFEELTVNEGEETYMGWTPVLTEPYTQQLAHERECALIVVPSTSFGKGDSIRIVCKAGLQAKRGMLSMMRDTSLSFSVCGDLKLMRVFSDRNFHPDDPVFFEFSNPVRGSEFQRHVSFAAKGISIKQRSMSDYPVTTHDVKLDFVPETTYTGVITRGLKDVFGNVLESDAPFSFHTSSYPPSISMMIGPNVVDASATRELPVEFRNCDSVGLVMGSLARDRIVPCLAGMNFYDETEWTQHVLDSMGIDLCVQKIWMMPSDPHNQSHKKSISLDTILGASRTGIVCVQLQRFQPDYPRFLKTVIQVTDLGVTGKFAADSILIWATHLKDASPAIDAEIELRTDSNRVLWRGITDRNGIACLPGYETLGLEPSRMSNRPNEVYGPSRPPRLWVIVTQGDDCAFMSSQWGDLAWGAFGQRISDPDFHSDKYEAVTFTDRGLYKAGETVNMKSIVRERKNGAWHVAFGARARVIVHDPRGEEVLKQELPLDRYGSCSIAIPIRGMAPTGYYQAMVFVCSGDDTVSKELWMAAGEGSFRVEAFRAAEFEVHTSFERGSYTIGDTVQGRISARYLFGAPLKGASMRWGTSLYSVPFTPKGYDEYSFGALRWLTEQGEWSSYKKLNVSEAMLGDSGSLHVSVPLPTHQYQGTQMLMLEGGGTSASHQMLFARGEVIVHGGEYNLGVKPGTTIVPTDSTQTISIVTVAHDGVMAANRTVTLRIYNRSWRVEQEKNVYGYFTWRNVSVDTLVDSAYVTTGAKPSVYRFTPSHAGFYYVSAQSTDDRGNEIETQAAFFVSGQEPVAWNQKERDRIELIADRARYAPGEQAEIFVKNPFRRAQTLISIEREGILAHYTTTLEGSAPRIRIPIEHSYLPNVFVSVMLLETPGDRFIDSSVMKHKGHAFRIGYLKLAVSPSEQRLRVRIEPSRTDYRPGDTVTATVTVRNWLGAGVRSELTLSAADDGVLSMTGYRLPDPFDAFYRDRRLVVTTTETRRQLGGSESATIASAISIHDGPGSGSVRKEFGGSAYWNSSLETDDSGRAIVRFKLPDNLTAFRLMAIAQTPDSRFGEGDTTFRVNKPLLLQPSLPRLARAGDRFDAGVVVINDTPRLQRISVQARAKGITISADATVIVELQPHEAREVTFPFAANKPGTGMVTFTARSTEDTDGLECAFPVAAQRPSESVALYSSTIESACEEKIHLPRSVIADEGELEATVASTAMVGLSGGMSYLFTYPYGCLEQKASSVLPIILAEDLIKQFRFDVFKDRDHRETAQKTIDEMLGMQYYDGGFVYWKGDQASAPFVSASAICTLVEAKDRGYKVSARAIDNGLEYLSRMLSGQERTVQYSGEASQSTHALIVYALARAGRANVQAMDKLFAGRDSLTLFAKAYLMRAAALADKNSAIVTELARDLSNRVKIDATGASFEEPVTNGLAQIFHSNTRTTALILQALLDTGHEAELGAKIVRRLLNVQRNGRWRTTQENLFVISALASYFKKYERDEPAFHSQIELEGRALIDERFMGRSLETKVKREPLASIPRGRDLHVSIRKQGEGRLYYGLRLNYRLQGETLSMNEGLTVIKTITSAEERGTPANNVIRTGQLMSVTVTVFSDRERRYVSVYDPVPAGFEIVATNFATSESTRSGNTASSAFNHTEGYDDRMLFFADFLPAGVHSYTYLVRAIHSGTYTQPSTRA